MSGVLLMMWVMFVVTVLFIGFVAWILMGELDVQFDKLNKRLDAIEKRERINK